MELHSRPVVYAYPAWVRFALALLVGLRFAGVWLVALLVLLATDPPITPPVLFPLFACCVALPWTLEATLRARFRAESEWHSGLWVLQTRRFRIEVPESSLAYVVLWIIPLPRPGGNVHLRSGRMLRERIEGMPAALAERWAKPGAPRMQAASLAFLRARCTQTAWRPRHFLLKYAAFALLPALVAFHLHQHIAYGSFWGEYYLRGARAFLRTAGEYYGTVVIYLLLYAGLLRSAAEAGSWLATLGAPRQAGRWRWAAERFCQIGYYGGVPAVLALRLLL